MGGGIVQAKMGYLKDALSRILTTPQSQIDTLMLRLWKAATGSPNSS